MTQMKSLIDDLGATLTQVLSWQGDAEFSDPEVFSTDANAYARDRVFAVSTALKAAIDTTPAEAMSLQGMEQIQGYANQMRGEFEAFRANHNAGHIQNAANSLDTIIRNSWALGIPAGSLEVSLDVFKAQSERSQRAIEQLAGQRDVLRGQITELQNQVAAAVADLEGLKVDAARERAEAAATVAKLEQQFAGEERDRANAFEGGIKGLAEQFNAFQQKAQSEAAAIIELLEGRRAEAAKIVQVVGNIGATGNYQLIADREQRAANTWRWITLGLFGVGIAVALSTFLKFWSLPMSPDNAASVALRLLYAIVITAPAWYTARESARHRTTADHARRVELELASIGPFIELLPEDKKIEIRGKLVEAYFGKSSQPHDVQPPVDMKEVVKELKGLVAAVRKG